MTVDKVCTVGIVENKIEYSKNAVDSGGNRIKRNKSVSTPTGLWRDDNIGFYIGENPDQLKAISLDKAEKLVFSYFKAKGWKLFPSAMREFMTQNVELLKF